VTGGDRVQGGEYGAPRLSALRDGVDDQFAICEFAEIGSEPDDAQRLVPAGLGELSCPHCLVQ
jgi:hypothetical protein